MITEPLDTALLLEEDGHLSEVGAATLADGQDELVPQEILRHVEGCPVCMERLGEQAVQTELAQRVIGSIGSPEEAGQSAEIPWWALAAAATLVARDSWLSSTVPRIDPTDPTAMESPLSWLMPIVWPIEALASLPPLVLPAMALWLPLLRPTTLPAAPMLISPAPAGLSMPMAVGVLALAWALSLVAEPVAAWLRTA